MSVDDGQRLIPDALGLHNRLVQEHLARYHFAGDYVRGRVLDLACGVGYGSQYLASRPGVAEVIGIDHCPATIQYARRRYPHGLVEYHVADALDTHLPERFGLFDTICSFETIEHLSADKLFLRILRSMLAPGGLLIISTPFGRGRGQPCADPYHVWQYRPEEFRELLAEVFPAVTLYYQLGSQIELPRGNKRYFLGVALCRGG
ncbi:MAG: class I SAM-dependent methyltransferase [Limnochordia bacterium]